ncbi:MAG: peptidylprolyl isomerase [Ilumatobacteraceae bacterium]|nr:peptidylprolyl isomerase [Ilumatobacteraceae bacterium]
MGTDKRERKKNNRDIARAARARAAKRAKVRRRGLQVGLGIPAAVLAIWAVATFAVDDSSDSVDVTDTTITESETPTLTTVAGASVTGDTTCPVADGSASRTTKFEKAPPMCIDEKKSYTATMSTSEGDIVIELDTKNTPKTVNNFVVLSRYKYYDDSFIFRTDPGLDIIQGGGSNNTDNPGYTIEDEGSGYKYSEGQIAMARTGEPNSAGGQFFIITGPNAAALDGQGTYVVFGQIAEGLDVAKAIIALNSGSGELGGAPSREVKISKVTITES